MYPDKTDVKKTKEFISWREAITNTENSESNIIVQHLYTDVSYGGKRPKATNNGEKPDTESDTESDNGEKATNNESDTESDNGEKATNNESDTESDNGEKSTNNESDTESDTEEGTSNTFQNQSPYRDNMLLEIPLENYLPQPTVNSSETGAPSNNSNDYDYEFFSDERLQEIVAELRNDPELRNIFDEPQNVEEDEGIELRTLEEEVQLDFEPFDYRLEVELSDWENQL